MGGPDINISVDVLILCLSFPVVVYHNADLQKQDIYSDAKGISGIYMWVNLINGNRYVGSSRDLHRRFSSYYSIAYLTRYNTTKINRALLKHKYSAFSLQILEYCKVEDLIKREQHYIDLLKPEYNILKEAGSSSGLVVTEEWKLINFLAQPNSIKVLVTDLENMFLLLMIL